MNPFDLISSTGLGSCLMIALGIVGIPLAYWWDAKKMPGVGAPGEDNE